MITWIKSILFPETATKRADGANSTTGINAMWRPKMRPAEHDNKDNWTLTTARARNLARNSGYISRYLQIIPQMAVADGREPMPRTIDASGNLDEGLNDRLKSEYMRWADTCDAAGQLDLWQIQDVILRTTAQDGEIFAHVYIDATPPAADIPLKIALYEVDYLDQVATSATPDKTTIYRGIEVDKNGKPVRYHFKNPDSGTRTVIPADQILHIYRKDRASQIHGETWLYPIVQLIKNLDEMAISELISARTQSTIAGVVTSKSPENYAENGGLFGVPSGTPSSDTDSDSTATKHEYLPTGDNSGAVLYMGEGEDLKLLQTVRPNSVFDSFIKLHLQQISAGLGVSYAVLTGDYRSTYTGSRQEYMQDQNFIKSCFKLLEAKFLVPLYRMFVKQAAIKGIIPTALYNRNPSRYEAVTHSKPVFPYFKPAEDQKVQLELVKLGVLTLDELAASMGKDLKSTLKQRAKENELLTALGLPLPGDNQAPELADNAEQNQNLGGNINAINND